MAAPAEAPPNAAEPGPSPVVFPADGVVTAAWCAALAATLAAASLAPAAELPRLLPAKELSALIAAATRAVKDDEALVALAPGAGGRITVVGDTHGQYHDVLRLLELAGCPSADNLFILNGDFVDRRARRRPSALGAPPRAVPPDARPDAPTRPDACGRARCAEARGAWR